MLAKSLGFIIAVSVVGPGCVAVVPHQPDTTLVAKGGIEDVKKRITEVLNRAVQPHVTSVEVTPDSLKYSWSQAIMGPFFAVQTLPGMVQILYSNIARVEVYDNNKVFVWAPGDARREELLFANLDDAKLFADLLLSLKAAPPK